MRCLLILCVLLAPAGPLCAAAVTDPTDRQIVRSFLAHVGRVPDRISEAYCKTLAAEEPEGYTWKITPQLRMPLVAFRLTGDPKYLDLFARVFDRMRSALTRGPDGYLGWYGKPLPLFRNPARPEQKVDVMITSFSTAHAAAEFLEETAGKPELSRKYARQRAAYLDLIEKHLVRKWERRGNVVDLGKRGSVFRTHAGLRDTKAHLTQPANKHSIIARSYLALYRVTAHDRYMRMAVKIGTRFKHTLTLRNGHYEWNYWDPAGAWDIHPADGNRWKHWIGVEHRSGYYGHSVALAVDLYHHGVVFDRTDITRFLKTQLTVCWNGNMKNPYWARVDGTRSAKYMRGAYMSSALAPLDKSIETFVFAGPRQAQRLKRAAHPWQGGPVAARWLENKLWWLPRARGGKQVYLGHGRTFLAREENKALHDALSFQIRPPGYVAPRTPVAAKPKPPAK